MATYRKPLKDIDGNFIIPAMTGDQTEWVQTGDIADNAVTRDKIDLTSLNPFVITNDTATDTYFVTERTDTGTTAYFGIGQGGTNHGIYSGPMNKWMIRNDSSHQDIVYVNETPISFDYLMKYMPFTTYKATNITTANINLNSAAYCKVGKYYCTNGSTGASQSNNPSGTAYQMWVININSDVLDITDGTWRYFGRLMLAINGLWWQNCNTNGSGTLSFGAWKQLHN